MSLATLGGSLEDAYRHCVSVTRGEARNFYYGIRLLPPPRRAALCAVYAFARLADDIGDTPGAGVDQRLARLARLRADLAGLAPDSHDPVLAALGDAARRFPLPVEALGELLDGIEMDLRGTRYRTFEELVVYCRRVAGTVGRLCVGVFGVHGDRARALRLADALGVALQQTNILRDVREDWAAGRVYLPQEDLDRFGVTLEPDIDGRLRTPQQLAALVAAAAVRAEGWYAEGLGLLGLLDWRSRASCAAMAGIYHRLNQVIAEDPAQVARRRVSLSPATKATVAVRSLAGARP